MATKVNAAGERGGPVESGHREDADIVSSSDDYARRFSGAVGRFFLEVQAEATLDLLRPFPGARVLDVGGGHGQLTGPLVEAGYHVTVLGSDPACEKRVRDWTGSGRARFLAADLLEPGLPGRGFDVVLSYRLLPHVERWPALVATLCRLAGRAVIVDFPTKRSVNAIADLFFGLKKNIEKDTRPFKVFREAEIAGVFEDNGFRETGRRPQFFWPMALHRATGKAALARALETAAGATGLRRLLGSPVILRLEPRG